MAIRYSDATTALIAGDVGLRRALSGAHLVFYTGTQPSSANNTPGTSQAILAFTIGDGVYVAETQATWQTTLSGWASGGGLSSIKIDNAEILGTTVISTESLAVLGENIAEQINSNIGNVDYTATYGVAGSGVLEITAPIGTGAFMNSCVLTTTTTGTLTSTLGSAGAVITTGVTMSNGLTFNAPLDGAGLATPYNGFYIEKPAAEVWKGKNGFGPATAAATALFSGIVDGSTYTAGWGRLCASSGDDGSTATSGDDGYIRLDFSVGTGSEDFTMSPSATFTVNTASGSEIETVINTFRLKVSDSPS